MARRKTYHNGDPITLNGCDGCSPSMINGVLCHEAGCPEAWRDYSIECFECGRDFYRTKGRHQTLCGRCSRGGR